VPNLAQAVDFAVERARRIENRLRLERDTAAYFASLDERTLTDENRLESALTVSVDEIDFEN